MFTPVAFDITQAVLALLKSEFFCFVTMVVYAKIKLVMYFVIKCRHHQLGHIADRGVKKGVVGDVGVVAVARGNRGEVPKKVVSTLYWCLYAPPGSQQI